MASTQSVLNIFVNAQTSLANAKLSQVDAKMKAMAGQSAATGGMMGKIGTKGKLAAGGIAAVGIAAGVAAKQLYDVGAELDQAYDTIRSGTGATGKQLEALKKDFRSVAGQVPNDFKETGTAIADLNTRLGLTGKPLRKMSKNMLDLSNITGDDLGGSIKAVSKAFVDWEVPASRSTKTLNGFYRLSQASGASVGDLTTLVQKFGSPLRTLGYDVNEAGAMFATFERAGVNIETMVPGLKIAIAQLTKPTGMSAEAMEKFGIKSGDAEAGLKQVMSMMSGDKLKDAQKMSLAMAIFGQRAGADMKEAILQGRFEFDKFTNVMKNGQDTIGKTAKDTYSAGENMKIFGNKLKLIVAPAAEWLHTKIAELTAGMVTGIKAVRRFTRTNEDWKTGMKVLGVVMKVLGHVIATVWDLIKKHVEAGLQMWRGAFKIMGGVVKIFTSLIKGDFRGMWDGLKQMFRGGLDILVGLLKGATAPFRAAAKGIWNTLKDVFRNGANVLIDIVRGIIGVVNIIPGVSIKKPERIAGDLGSSGPGFGKHQRGAYITGGKPSGDSVPALLERGEYVLNREAVKKVGVGRLNELNYKAAPRFQEGGHVGLIGGGLAGAALDAAGAAVDVVKAGAKVLTQGPGTLIDLLPKPDIPQPLTGAGPWMIDKAVEFIKDKLSIFGNGGKFSGNLDGAKPGFGPLMDFLNSRYGPIYVMSGLRPGSITTSGNLSNHATGNAVDISTTQNGLNHATSAETLNATGIAARRMDALHGFMARNIDLPGDFLWRTYTGGNHYNHIHRGITSAHADNPLLMAQYLSGLPGYRAGATRSLRQGKRPQRAHEGLQRGGPVGMERGGIVKAAIVARMAGWRGKDLATAIAVAGAESNYDPRANLVTSVEDSRGLWQINTMAHGGGDELYRPLKNAKVAYALWKEQGWSPWAGYTSGNYRDFFGRARGAMKKARHILSGGGSGGSGGSGSGGSGSGSKGRPGHQTGSGGFVPGRLTPAQEKAYKEAQAAKKQRRRKARLSRLSGRGLDYPLKGRLRKLDKKIGLTSEWLELAENNAGAVSGPGGSDLTEGERLEQVKLTEKLLKQSQRKAGWIAESISHLYGVGRHFSKRIKDLPEGQKWKLPGLKKARNNARGVIKDTLLPAQETLIGLTGEGGEIASLKLSLKELGVTGTSDRDNEMADLLRAQLADSQKLLALSQAQMPIFQQYLPKYHTGGIVPGRGEQPVTVMGGEGIFTRDQLAAMGGSAPLEVTIVVEDGAVDSSRIRAEVKGYMGDVVTRTRTGRTGRKYVTNG